MDGSSGYQIINLIRPDLRGLESQLVRFWHSNRVGAQQSADHDWHATISEDECMS
jgi:hypothetical protein